MLAHASRLPDEEPRDASFADTQYTQSGLIEGTEWVLSTLGDLANYCAFNQLNDVETTLRKAMWEASLQLKQAQRQNL